MALFSSSSASAQTPVLNEFQKLLASDGAASDFFGSSVAVSGEVAVIGASSNDNDNGEAAGAAYVYRYDGTGWVEEQKLLASDGEAVELFGSSVAVTGDVALIGANLDDDNGEAAGAAYVYRYDGTSWVEEQKLLASDGTSRDFFGRSVAVTGNVALIGANGDFPNGSAYVYRYDGTSWVAEQKLLPSDGSGSNRSFGESVAISGNVALIGAQWDDDNGNNSGAAYVYRYDGTSWVEEQKLLASDGTPFDTFGDSVAISEGVAVIGAERHGDNGGGAGAGAA
jgi:hypothetical protein